ncbi:MAG: hypothetical protein DGJ47_000804 [Rickettsiaceae bacterium]
MDNNFENLDELTPLPPSAISVNPPAPSVHVEFYRLLSSHVIEFSCPQFPLEKHQETLPGEVNYHADFPIR